MDFPTRFVDELAAARTGEDAVNPYAGHSAAARRCRTNLHAYLSLMGSPEPSLLLVGEAPGYRGCRLTGVPFTSEHILAGHARFGRANGFVCGDPDGRLQREASATIVWKTLDELGIVPLLWNIYPFHPHRPDHRTSNRPPRAAEIRQGERYVRSLLRAYPVDLVVAVGRKAADALRRWDIPAASVRHPAHGGGAQFHRELVAVIGQSTT